MFYTYVLQNTEGEFYTGFTVDLRRRLAQHNQGRNFSTKNRVWQVVYYEACTDETDARRRENYLKTSAGRRALRLRLKVYLRNRREPKLH